MKSLLLLAATLGVAFGWAFHDNFVSKRLDGEFEPFGHFVDTVEEDTLNESHQIVNGEFTTPLDHFNPTDRRRLQMVFKANMGAFEEGGPIFININHLEGLRWITSGLVFDHAQRVGGALVTSDLRFMGRNSLPNITEEHYRLYTVDHMVADVAHLITQVRHNFNSPMSKVVVFGGRVGGTIAVLARKRFPHLIDGAWSSGGLFRLSAPNDVFFDRLARNIFLRGPEGCARSLSTALQNITQLVVAKNLTRIRQLFGLCDDNDFSHDHDPSAFYEVLYMWIGRYIDSQHYQGILDICRDINRGPDPVTALARWVNYVYDRGDSCRNVTYARRLLESQRMGFVSYGSCLISGIFLFTTSPNETTTNVFPSLISPSLPDRRCQDLLGETFNAHNLILTIDNFHVQHGADVQMTSNVIFSFGDLDPFMDMGVGAYNIDTSQAVRTALYSAQADMNSHSDYDSADLRATKKQVLAAIRRFTLPVETQEEDDTINMNSIF